MIQFFKNKRKQEQPINRPALLLKPIQHCYGQAQKKWVGWMESLTAGLSIKTLKVLLVAFVVVTGALCSLIVINSLSPQRTRIPVRAQMSNPYMENGKALLDETTLAAEYQQLKKHQLLIDSLAKSPVTKLQLDSLLKAHPGMMDRLNNIENYYRLQLKK